ncbi:MAG: MobC family plasmid mobilization relaxosome protein [Lachnospiraceae bacterium]|nr:MobC family plasmid mobilization relaxosome protein [Lachnospiraceae bacterium]
MGKTKGIKFRCEEEDYSSLVKSAESLGMTISEYCRSRLFEPDKVLFRASEKKDIQNLVYEINKIGTNINQIVRSCHSKNWISESEIEKLISELKKVEKAENEIMNIVMGKM